MAKGPEKNTKEKAARLKALVTKMNRQKHDETSENDKTLSKE